MEMLTAPEVAQRLRVCPRQLDYLWASGAFPRPVRIGRKKVWADATVDAWIEDQQRAADGECAGVGAQTRGPGRPRGGRP